MDYEQKKNSTNITISNDSVAPIINDSIKKVTFFERIGRTVRLHWNFGKYNNNKLLPKIDTPLKYIEINERRYNGDYGKGSIFENINKFYFYGKTAIISSRIEFCLNESTRDKAKVEVSIPFVMSGEEFIKLDEIVKEITSNNDYKYNESHYSKDTFDFKKFSYVDVIIEGIEYEILSNDNVLRELKKIIKCELSDNIVSQGYDKLIKD